MLDYIKMFIKNIIFSINLLFVILIEVPKCIYLVSLNRKKKLFHQAEGGFGHLMATPMFLDSKYNDDWVLLFSYQKVRHHNKYIKKIFPNKLIFINNGIFSNYLGINTDKFYSELSIKIVVFLSKIFFKVNILNYIDYALSLNSYKSDKKWYFSVHESRIWKNLVDYANGFEFENKIKKEIRDFDLNFITNYTGKVLFPIRTKGSKTKGKDFTNKIRDTRDINDFKEILEDLEARNYLVFLSGDKIQYPEWIKNSRNLITCNKTSYNKDYFNFMAGISADIVIGVPSGGTMYSMLGKKSLFLESWDFGLGFYKTIISHPKIKVSGYGELKDILTDRYLVTRQSFFKSENVTQLTKKELFEIYYDFIENINSESYGIDPKVFGINEGWLIDSKSKISNKWLEIIQI